MDGGTATALFGLGGTVVGGLITSLGQWHSTRAERGRLRMEQQDRKDDLRRQACLGFLTTVDHFQECARDLCGTVSSSRSGEVREDARARYDEAWRLLVTKLAEPQVSGPAAVAAAASRVHDAAAAYGNAVDTYATESRHSEKRDTERDDLENAMIAARRDFAASARTALSLDA